jgi:predicted nucleotidyltransferase
MEQIDLLRYALNVLERLGIPYALVGSFGSSAFGEPRSTRDIDILIDLPESKISLLCAAFPAPDFLLQEVAVRDAVRQHFQFNLLHPASGNKIDFILPRSDAWGRSQLSRAKRIRIQPNLEANVASPEDVIVGKLWYFSLGGGERHLRDIAGILRVSGDRVNRDEIEHWAAELGYAEVWRQVVRIADGPDRLPGPGVP